MNGSSLFIPTLLISLHEDWDRCIPWLCFQFLIKFHDRMCFKYLQFIVVLIFMKGDSSLGSILKQNTLKKLQSVQLG